ncbi:MAG: non-homologous end-joining DNA ligase [Nocardioidaceae bacterium]
MRPMLASRGTSVPTGPDWVHEVKWDGMRVLAEVRAGTLVVRSRNENDVTVSFPELAGLADVGHDLLLDGEVVALDSTGIPTFGALADRMHVRNQRRAKELSRSNPVTLLVFDVLALDGEDLTGRTLRERRAVLEGLGLAGPHWQVPPTYDDGQMLLTATAQQGLEGVVSKKLASTYHPGRRTTAWLKFPHRRTGSYVVGGWRLETDSTSRLGAVLVGEPSTEGLLYRGRVGSGIAGKAGQRLRTLLDPLLTDASPFVDEVPKEDAAGTVWTRPEVVVEVASLGLTPGRRLRQPSYLGVREDLSPDDVPGS